MKQFLKLKLSQKLSPQQIQLMKLIQLPTLDFEQKIQREIEENPALEQGQNSSDENDNENDEDYSESDDLDIDDYINYDDTPSYKLNSNNSGNQEDKNIPFSSGISFTQHLISQLKPISLSEKKMRIAEFLVGSIDESYFQTHVGKASASRNIKLKDEKNYIITLYLMVFFLFSFKKSHF